jgi:hypothetical protein
MRLIGRILGWLLIGLAVTGLTLWGVGALYYAGPGGDLTRSLFAAAFALATAAAFLILPNRRRTFLGFGIACVGLFLWWSTIEPSNDREWQPDVAVLPTATVDGDRVTMRNIRNLEYRTEFDFTPRYYDKTFDLKKLDSVDMIASYWAGEDIAHLFLSFGFGGEDYVAVSVETRKEKTEGYSTLKGFFKQYELFYVVADERDLIRVRTNYRKPAEDVYVYRLRLPRAQVRRLFMDYVSDINELAADAEFYNTLTTNCTTAILLHAQASGGIAQYNWKILLSGHTPEYAYELGKLDNSLPFEELRRRSRVNDRARAANDAPDFSQRIRAGIPLPPPPG